MACCESAFEICSEVCKSEKVPYVCTHSHIQAHLHTGMLTQRHPLTQTQITDIVTQTHRQRHTHTFSHRHRDRNRHTDTPTHIDTRAHSHRHRSLLPRCTILLCDEICNDWSLMATGMFLDVSVISQCDILHRDSEVDVLSVCTPSWSPFQSDVGQL